MNTQGKHILVRFLKRWQFMLVLEIMLYAIGASLFVYFLSGSLTYVLITFILTAGIASLIIKPWTLNLKSTSSYLDSKIDAVEYSTGLLLTPWENHSNLAKLQQLKISEQLSNSIKKIRPPNRVAKSTFVSCLLVLLGFLCYQFNVIDYFNTPQGSQTSDNTIIFRTKDSSNLNTAAPKIQEQWVTVSYPKYTNKKSYSSSKMDLKVLEGSQVFWKLKFDSQVDSVFMESMGNNYPMNFTEGFYKKNKILKTSGFYNFKFRDTHSHLHASDLFAIETFKDKAPEIKFKNLKQFTSFNYNDDKTIQFISDITDDFGIFDAYIIATVSKGKGESVKFREEKLPFDKPINKGSKTLTLSKKINLDSLKMEPGDELYFYIEASDFKTPEQNVSRSETYFAVIKDTTSYDFEVESNLGVNRMPDYFRSQRQLIIDTEKLIKEKPEISSEDFKSRSNELGFDQKALRLKYGEFMGIEAESGLDVDHEASPEHEGEEHHDDEDHDSEDPLAAYTHDHDGDNEHNLVETQKEEDGKSSKNPLQEFIHDHGDPEMATLFQESLKIKMHKAMTEMWDAELYLRLYQPEKSLPYQYRALQLIQDIKNHARIYVHRIGFDPPPIKEDKRLTGKKLDEIKSNRKNDNLEQEDTFKNIKLAIIRLGALIDKKTAMSTSDQDLLEKAAQELSVVAIDSPTKHLNTLQLLKRVIEQIDTSTSTYKKLKNGLMASLPRIEANPKKHDIFMHELDKLLLKDLSIND